MISQLQQLSNKNLPKRELVVNIVREKNDADINYNGKTIIPQTQCIRNNFQNICSMEPFKHSFSM